MTHSAERVQLIAELRRIAATEPRFTYDSLYRQDRPLLQRLLTEFGDLARARKAARVAPPSMIRKWTPERISDELQQAYRATRALTVQQLMATGHSDLVSAIKTHGGIVHARRLAGLPEPVTARPEVRERWDADRVVSEIVDRHARGDSVAFSRVPSNLARAGKRFFGSWQEAIEAAGLRYDEVRLLRPAYTSEEIIALLQHLAKEQPRMLWGALYEHSAFAAMVRCFGSVPEAVKASGVVGWPLVGQGEWSRENVVRAVQLTQRPRVSALAPRIGQVARWYAGGSKMAREAAGVTVLRHPWNRERVITELRACADRGETPSSNLKAACARLFGGMAAAREAAGIQERELAWSHERILAELREHAARGEAVSRGPLAEACIRHFGGIRAARRAAGVADPPPRSSWWTRERVIEALQREQATGERLGRMARQAAVNLFGSTHAAREAAGTPRRRAQRDSWSPQRVLNELRRFAREDREPTQRVSKEARRLFGSLSAAQEAAKVRRVVTEHWTRERVLEALKAWKPGATMRRLVRRAAERHFGSLAAALEASGNAARFGRWDQATVVAELREAAKHGGRIRPALALAARRQFGTITDARLAAGVPLLHRRWTAERVLAEVRRHGDRALPEALRSACDRFFGSVASAREAMNHAADGVRRRGAAR